MGMLEVKNLSVAYDYVQVLWDVSISLESREIVSLLGPNGSGKSTLMNSISRLVPSHSGEVWFKGQPVHKKAAHQVNGMGISHVLERHRLFPYMSVKENLLLGAGARPAQQELSRRFEYVYGLFPPLFERKRQLARTLSGGEQQMCAIGRGLMSRPDLLMVDEPFIGLSPRYRELVAEVLQSINREGVAILLIEQNVKEALRLSHRAFVLQAGRIALAGDARELEAGSQVEAVFFGKANPVRG